MLYINPNPILLYLLCRDFVVMGKVLGSNAYWCRLDYNIELGKMICVDYPLVRALYL